MSVTAADDDRQPDSATLTHDASGGGYGNVTIASVAVQVWDTDRGAYPVPPVRIDDGGIITVDEGGSATYSVSLTMDPIGTATVTVEAPPKLNVSPNTLSFNESNWSQPQTVTVSVPQENSDTSDERLLIGHTITEGNRSASVDSTQVWVTDDDDGEALVGPRPANALWWAALTPRRETGGALGYLDHEYSGPDTGKLSDSTFVLRGVTREIEGLFIQGGRFQVWVDSGDGFQLPNNLVLHVGNEAVTLGSASTQSFETTYSGSSTPTMRDHTYRWLLGAHSVSLSDRQVVAVWLEDPSGTYLPAEPRSVRATAKDSAVELAWTAPPEVPSKPVTHYEYQKSNSDEWTATDGPETTTEVKDLVNGDTYKFRLRAVNDAGKGAASAPSEPVTPGAPGLTAEFVSVPASHDGSAAFTVRLAFTDEVDISAADMRTALTATGATVTDAQRVDGSTALWDITITPAGNATVQLLLSPTSDCAATGAICTADGRKLSGPLTVTVAGSSLPELSVADAQVQEGPNATLAFAVSLDRAASGPVTVGYMTANGTATAGSDYTAASGMLTFAAGETAKTVTVAVLDDAHDEGSETLDLVLMNASGAYLADGEATGTISNSDPMPQAWMVRMGRTVGSQAVDALTQRLDGAASSHITVAGINIIGAPGVAPELEADGPFALPEWAKSGALEPEARTITGEDLVLRSAFHLSGGEANGEGTAFTAWGRVATGGFEAEVDDVTMDGDVTTGLVGFDAEWERLLAGVMLSHSKGEGSYRLDPSQGDDAGTLDSSLTGVYPYARMELNERVSAWALAGVGSGELTLEREGKADMATDLSMRMGALGVKGRVLDGGRDGLSVNVKSDALWVGMENERTSDMLRTQGDVTRLRLIVEGERAYAVGEGATFTPSAEVGLRHDGGDAETGTGVEVGAGLRYSAGPLSIEGRVRTLVAHEDSGYEEWGASGAIRVSPGASGRGLTLSIAPAWGRTGSATEQLWSARDASALAADEEFEAASRLEMEAGYGLGLAGNRGVLTPYAGATLGDGGSRTMRSGVRWTLGSELAVTAEATRNESAGAEVANEVRLRAALRF